MRAPWSGLPRDLTLLLGGAFLSNVGSWMQNITVPFVLFKMTGSGTWVGIAGSAQFLPAVPLAPISGALADRCDRRRAVLVGQVDSSSPRSFFSSPGRRACAARSSSWRSSRPTARR